MWTKIRSNRDPGDTVYAEIKKEFRPYFEKAGKTATTILQKFPKSVFTLMIISLVTSMVLTFTVFRHPEPGPKPVAVIHPLQNGFDQLLRAGTRLKETIRLKKLIDSITAKKQLDTGDSAVLAGALDSLQHIRPTLK